MPSKPLACAATAIATAALLLASACSAPAESGPLGDVDAAPEPFSAPETKQVGDDSTNSYELTSSPYKVSKLDHTVTKSASCADGFYIRSGPASLSAIGSGINPYVKLGGNKDWVSVSAAGYDRYGKGNNWSPFKSMKVTLTNRSFDHDHTVTFSWWCDAVTPWLSATRTRGDRDGSKPAVGGIPPNCYYCGWNVQKLASEGPGDKGSLASANGSSSDGTAVITNAGTAQTWNYVSHGFSDWLPVYSVWFGSQGMDKSVIVEDSTTHEVSLRHSSGSTPGGGSWFYLNQVQGPSSSGVMLVNTDSLRCLAAGTSAGDRVQTRTCNTLDTDQWWDETD